MHDPVSTSVLVLRGRLRASADQTRAGLEDLGGGQRGVGVNGSVQRLGLLLSTRDLETFNRIGKNGWSETRAQTFLSRRPTRLMGPLVVVFSARCQILKTPTCLRGHGNFWQVQKQAGFMAFRKTHSFPRSLSGRISNKLKVSSSCFVQNMRC